MMNTKKIWMARILTYSGLLPFLILNIAIILNPNIIPIRWALYSYAAVIISFISGIHWAAYLFFPNRCFPHLLLQSNLITLLGWFALFLGRSQATLIIQGLCFICLLRIDFDLHQKKIISPCFFDLRLRVSIVLILLLFIGCWL